MKFFKMLILEIDLKLLLKAGQEGFDPTTIGLEVQHSIHAELPARKNFERNNHFKGLQPAFLVYLSFHFEKKLL